MAQPVIEVQDLSKRFIIHHELAEKQRYQSLRDVISRRVKSMVTTETPSIAATEEFWALRNVNFKIEQGERVGIIGRNGAGKSTLLKILSQITEPSQGSVRIRGRVASLLEVGTGFHPELTGRENIFLNGAILGMTRAEVRQKFDEIVAFAEIEKFLDTPVKRYSSGMYVRLAFAVAAHLEPEILIVDEVLAVGDAQFQKKCLGKMEDVSKGEGRTVLFVSHNMQAISTLCSHGIFLQKGVAMPKVSAREAVNNYTLYSDHQTKAIFPIERKDVLIHNFTLQQRGQILLDYDGGLPIQVIIEFELKQDLSNFRIGFFVKNLYGELLNRSLLADWNSDYSTLKKGTYKIIGQIPSNLLVAGNYSVQVHASRFGLVDYGVDEPTTINFSVLSPELYNQAYIGETAFGSVLIKQDWQIESD